MSEMLISTPKDTRRVEWDPKDEASVVKAKEQFDKIVEHNFAYKTTETGKEQIREFDPLADEIRVTAPLVGG